MIARKNLLGLKERFAMKLKYTRFQKALEFITLIILCSIWIYIIISWSTFPNIIAGNYDFYGKINKWSYKNDILKTPIMCTAIYVLLTVVQFFPSLWRMPVRITEQNREFVLTNVIAWNSAIKMELIGAFSYITYASGKVQVLGGWFFPLCFATIICTAGYFFLKIKINEIKINRSL